MLLAQQQLPRQLSVKARTYSFHSIWKIQAPRIKVWQALTAAPFSWQDWWPGMISFSGIETADMHIGTTSKFIMRAKSGYKLSASFTTTSYQPLDLVVFNAQGDLAGTATWKFTDHNDYTIIHIDWQVQTTKAWMNALAPLLKPIFVSNHNTLMQAGEAALNNFVNRKQ